MRSISLNHRPVPPEEIIPGSPAKEDEMLRAITGYGFQKSVLLEEIGPEDKPSGELKSSRSNLSVRTAVVMKRRPPTASTLQHCASGARRFGSHCFDSPIPADHFAACEIRNTFQGKQPSDELNTYIFAAEARALDRAHALLLRRSVGGRSGYVIVKTIGKWVMETGDVTSPCCLSQL